jgi:hypothetical protein
LAAADAWFQDVLTIDDAALNGQQGILLLDYALDGTISASGRVLDSASVFVEVEAGSQQTYLSPLYTSSVNGSFAIPTSFAFTYGQPFGLVFELEEVSFIGLSTNYATNASGTGSVNFGDTLILSGITAENSSGGAVSGATITSVSGTQYGPTGVVISPEPSSAVLLALGLPLFFLVGVLRRLTAR